MNIQALVSLDRTECAVQCNSKKRILEIISDIAAQANPEVEKEAVLSALLGREKVGSTGIGNGIALPHGRLPELTKVTAVVVTTTPAINFDAIDDKPVDIFFAILVPENQTEGHLQTLATIAGKLSQKEIIKAIRGAETKEEVIAALCDG
ncbi:PTS system, nitrogen regulatory IIA component [Marisediminitalea aggregata]|jgi:PTS system nitrogen regulatory IIA component|uniref:PTS system, nitrogen regulatory IIA component n=1 Tax=Marisediminitalea aggregata TaxID=634436 RepID=A0A1M5HMU9_9ALTE|nr:PTS IIA-like nitrogen regulatory protein PtsN [Marisediminitalea aggregata]MAP19327.1 PTS IIA-like nitrogen-regulatory protein PtsN [Alteromonadaceae bacterium]BBO29045.1 PTS IIA-like nitrogen-regulatory protein PtsN [Alteromonas sp. I4]HBY39397.1 PTS IIA-like nitrogen-regulatory protein PtsN [Alteromonas sp.]MAX42877.1 PTS IIA-like nitrogen-regulatory protein PtsN [Alteromonadaceae bacterium]SHG17257.1 PTS system, nitrogen regulatory IIA component [Marisediminitalea aggregata]|tara:strand:+ start:30579 stop:31028 length:450 start_codon:yes stop_codon:yes gene_type:complete